MERVMFVEAWRSGRVLADSEPPALIAMAEALSPLFTTAAPPERRALYVVSANAGFASSLAFWSGAAREGVAYASPALFPWTLSNAPCGWLAREFGVRGPNVTYTGRAEALGAALRQCREHLEQRHVEAGWVVAVDFGSDRRPTAYAAMRVSQKDGPAVLEEAAATHPGRSLRGSDALTRALRATVQGGCGAFSDGFGVWTIKVRPEGS